MSNRNISIVYLWSEITGYVTGVTNLLAEQVKSVDIIHWDRLGINSTKYDLSSARHATFHPRSNFNTREIFDFLVRKEPTIVVVSGWMDNGYINACKMYKKINSSTRFVAGIDDQWTGSFRQRIGTIYYSLFYRKLFDYMWVSGSPQFSFAQHFGYEIKNILSNLYAADSEIFKGRSNFSRRFLYVGRFVDIKAPDLLANAYNMLPYDVQKNWPLVFIGDGQLKEQIQSLKNPNIEIIPFLQPKELRDELLRGGVACMPSHKDQWGVAVHEFSMLGMPIILSSGVGSATEFLIPGFNGYMFESGDVKSLYNVLLRTTMLNYSDLIRFGDNSAQLGANITSKISAASLLGSLEL